MTRATKLALASTVTIIVIGGGWYLFAAQNDSEKVINQPQQTTETTNKDSRVDYNPPSDEQQQAEPADNKELPDNADEDQPTDNQQGVDVVLTRVTVSNDLVTAAGYVDIDTPGTCTLSLTSSVGTKTYSDKTQQDPANPENENCSNFRIPKSDLSAASKWTATLSYSSGNYSGDSQKWEFEL